MKLRARRERSALSDVLMGQAGRGWRTGHCISNEEVINEPSRGRYIGMMGTKA